MPIVGYGQRVVRVAPVALFPFDPLSTRYVHESLAPVVSYVEAWRNEGEKIDLRISRQKLGKGYKLYFKLEDSTLYNRVLTYLSALDDGSDTVIVEVISGGVYEFPRSRSFLDHFNTDIERIKRFYATPITILDTTLLFDPYSPGDYSQMMHAFQLRATSADLSLFAPPKLNVKLDKELYIRSVFNMFYYDNDLVVINLKGFEIRKILEEIYGARYFTLRDAQSDLLAINLPPSMHISLAGASFTVNLARRKGSRIEELTLKADTIYSVAMNSHLAKRYGKALVNKGDYKLLFINYLRNRTDIQKPEQWSLKPERWVKVIKERENLYIDNN